MWSVVAVAPLVHGKSRLMFKSSRRNDPGAPCSPDDCSIRKQETMVEFTTPPTSIQRPAEITRATNLLWLGLVISITVIAMNWRRLEALLGSSFAVTQTCIAVLYALVIWKVRQGRDWARVAFLIWFGYALYHFGYGLYHTVWKLPCLFHRLHSKLTFGLSILQLAINVYAVWLLFRHPGERGRT